MSNNKDFEVFIPCKDKELHSSILEILDKTKYINGTLAIYLSHDEFLGLTHVAIGERYGVGKVTDTNDLYYSNFNRVLEYKWRENVSVKHDSRDASILPIIKLSDEAFDTIIKNAPKNSNEIEFGYYPKNSVGLDQSDIRRRKKTGITYTLPYVNVYSYNEYNNIKLKEYRIGYDKFVFVPMMLENNDKKTVIFKVEPIKWKIDRERKILIATYPVLGGIPYNKDRFKQACPYKDSYLYYFLNEIFLRDAILSQVDLDIKKKGSTYEEKSRNEIEILIDEISNYSQYYHGSDDINSIVKSLIDKYNSDINSLKTSTGLTLYTEEGLYNNLISDLNRILDKLKRSSESSKEYHDILELINNCIDTFNGKSCESDNELYKDILSISKDMLPNISKNEDKKKEIKDRLLSLFMQDKDEIETYLKYISTFSDGINLRIDYKTLPYKNIKEYEKHFRIRLHPVLERMLSISKESETNELIQSRQNILNKIKDNYTNSEYVNEFLYLISIFRFARSESNNKHIDFLINSIKEEYKKLSSEVSEEELKGIITHNISSNDINDIVGALNEILKRIYRMLEEINSNKERIKRLNSYLIKL